MIVCGKSLHRQKCIVRYMADVYYFNKQNHRFFKIYFTNHLIIHITTGKYLITKSILMFVLNRFCHNTFSQNLILFLFYLK